eukprot:1156184-Pelagomonas_calceolata.AAC.18
MLFAEVLATIVVIHLGRCMLTPSCEQGSPKRPLKRGGVSSRPHSSVGGAAKGRPTLAEEGVQAAQEKRVGRKQHMRRPTFAEEGLQAAHGKVCDVKVEKLRSASTKQCG